MKSAFYLLAVLFLLLGCSSGDEVDDSVKELKNVVTKRFSDSLTLDTFKVMVTGNNIKDQKLVLTITKSTGVKIYNVSIKAKELFDNYDATIDLDNKKNQSKFLQSEVDRFFEEDNFLEPAVTENEKPDKNVPDKIFYEELRRSQLNGFIYRLGREKKIYIGWSSKENKVKTYYNCCR